MFVILYNNCLYCGKIINYKKEKFCRNGICKYRYIEENMHECGCGCGVLVSPLNVYVNGHAAKIFAKTRDYNGINNPFYGKKHTAETIGKSREKISIASKEHWKDPEYRDRVIKGASKPRREGFKQEQSGRITQWYVDNPKQRDIRSVSMKNNWESGVIRYSPRVSSPRSRMEIEFFKYLQISNNGEFDILENMTLFLDDNRYIFVDGFVDKLNIIIEFYGDYYHANPDIYAAEDIVRPGMLAKDIWNANTIRLLDADRNYIIVWESEYKKDRELSIDNVMRSIRVYDWEYCR